MTASAPEPPDVYATFVGGIDQAAAGRITNNLATAMNMKAKSAHILFQSTGGTVGDGIFLHNYFKALPLPLTLYNAGAVSSIATIAFLGAKHRKVSQSATFMLHRVSGGGAFLQAKKLGSVAESVILDDQRIEAILRAHLKLSEEQLAKMEHDLYFSAADAVKIGIADAVAEFAPPAGSVVYNI